MIWPQPYEGVTGTNRSDDLLTLDDALQQRLQLTYDMAVKLYRAQMTFQPESRRQTADRMMNAKPGDLVIETSSFRQSYVSGFGILLADRTEWAHTDAEWAALLAEVEEDAEVRGRWTDRAFYIQYGPGAKDIVRWTNASVAAVLTADELLKEAGR